MVHHVSTLWFQQLFVSTPHLYEFGSEIAGFPSKCFKEPFRMEQTLRFNYMFGVTLWVNGGGGDKGTRETWGESIF